LRITPRARQDYDDILVYSEGIWGQEQADRYEAALNRALDVLLDFPLMGRTRDDISPGLRSRQAQQHVIYYRVKGNVIEIVRILHERMDAVRQLSP
jgi:toxin ParE1/3/4